MAMVRVVALLLLLGASLALAQDASFVAEVNKNPVAVGEQFGVTFTLQSSSAGGGKNFTPPDLKAFQILSGPNQSTSMQFINGSVSSSVAYSYILQARDVGTFVIPSASIESGGKVLRTQPATMQVTKGAPGTKKQDPAGPRDLSAQIADNLFLKAVVDKNRVVQGEQITLTSRVYTRVRVQNYGIKKAPIYTGFWSEDIDSKSIPPSIETIDGKQFTVEVIGQVALFPTQSGNLQITPMELQAAVQVQDRKFFDPFGSIFADPFGRTVNYTVKSQPVKITVDPLPPGAPQSFKGAVGRFSITAKVDRENVVANEPVAFKVTISGTGNIKLLESPTVDFPTDFEQFPPKVSDKMSLQNGLLSGSKTFEYLVIPRYPGSKTINPVLFSYYDLDKRAYVNLSSAAMQISVGQGTGSAASSLTTSAQREGVQLLSQDIRFIKAGDGSLSRRGERLYASPLFVLLSVLPVLGFVVLFVSSRRREAAMRDTVSLRNRRAMRIAQKRLRQAEQLLTSSGRHAAFYSEAARALWNYLADKLNIQQADMSLDQVVAQLSARGVRADVVSDLKTLLESCEMARFGRAHSGEEEMKKTFVEAGRIIVELEKSLRNP